MHHMRIRYAAYDATRCAAVLLIRESIQGFHNIGPKAISWGGKPTEAGKFDFPNAANKGNYDFRDPGDPAKFPAWGWLGRVPLSKEKEV